jgi:hypothetical protein
MEFTTFLKEKKMRKGIVPAMLMLAMAFGGAARADDVNELKTQLAEQQKVLLQMQQRLEQLEANQKVQEQKVDEKITKAVASKDVNVPEGLKWAEKVKLSGDFRYRHESIDSQKGGKDQFGTNRNRIRARLGVDVKVNDEWDLGFRLATGAADPASTNQTLENGYSKKDIWFDLAYFNWHPKTVERLNVYGGKMPLPFYRAGGNQLIWDDDVNPEGIAAKYVIPLGTTNNLYINGGGFWLKADEGATGGAAEWGLQSYLKHDFENKDYLLGGLSFYATSNLPNKNGLYNSSGTSTSKYGNTMNGNGSSATPYTYIMNYDVLEGFAEYGFKIAERPASVYGSYVKNTSATTSEDSGWLIGTTFNKAKEAGSWELGYNYRDVQKDAVIGVITDSDFVGGGTDGKGHMICGKYQISKNIQAGLTYFIAKKGDAGDDYRRLMADLLFKF